MTPTEHRAAAESLLSPTSGKIANPHRAAVHARLSRAAGTGLHYERADALLARLGTTFATSPLHLIATAAAHAELAD